ncbi:MAG: signal peptidase II [Elusimicrobia bacterium]|nr:signal peptidase II [Elusimicrobiota bacterium]
MPPQKNKILIRSIIPALAGLAVFLADRFVKHLIYHSMYLGESLEILPFFSVTYLMNTGMAFSILSGNNTLLVLLNILILGFIIFILISGKTSGSLESLAYALVLGGASSNIFDRIFHSGVIDYIDLGFWPVFNIADSAITVGAVLLLIGLWLNPEKTKKSDVS